MIVRGCDYANFKLLAAFFIWGSGFCHNAQRRIFTRSTLGIGSCIVLYRSYIVIATILIFFNFS